MRFKLIFSILVLLICTSCATKIDFEQTCLTCVQSQRLLCKDHECPVTAMIGEDCIVIMTETGEKIFINEILKGEKITPRSGINVTIDKIRGRYFITGEEFNHLWMLTPKGNQAKLNKFEFPESDLQMPPVFEINNKNLLMRGENKEYTYIFNIDNEKWENLTPKAGL